jgi:hypothetical protein
VHGVALGGAGLVNDALEEAADRGVRQRARIGAFGVRKDFVFAVGLVERDVGRLFQFADFEGAVRALVQEFDELFVDFIDAAAPVAKVHGVASPKKKKQISSRKKRAMEKSSRFARNDKPEDGRQR